jgi:hypothetical protein
VWISARLTIPGAMRKPKIRLHYSTHPDNLSIVCSVWTSTKGYRMNREREHDMRIKASRLVHVRQRSKERIARKINRNDKGRIIAEIERGRALYAGAANNNRKIFLVRIDRSRWASVIYDCDTKQIHTVLRPNQFERLAISEHESKTGYFTASNRRRKQYHEGIND